MITTCDLIELDIHENNEYRYLYAKQYDNNSRYVTATLFNNGVKIVLDDDNTIARIRCTKPDNTYVLNDCNIKDNSITFELTENILSKEGIIRCDIGLYTKLVDADLLIDIGESLISSCTFHISVESAGYDESGIISSNEFSALTNALLKVEEVAKITEEAREATRLTNETREKIEQSFKDIEDRFDYIETTTEATVGASLNAVEAAKNAKISEDNSKISETNAKESSNSAMLSQVASFNDAERSKFYAENSKQNADESNQAKTEVDASLVLFNNTISSLRSKEDKLNESDFDTNLRNKLDSKANSGEVRLKLNAIAEEDLSYALALKINNASGGSSGVVVGGVEIDDTMPSYSKTYSSNNIENRINTIVDSAVSAIDISSGMTASERKKLAGIATSANNYKHPLYHPAEMILESDDKNFLTILEKEQYSDKYTKDEIDNKLKGLNLGIIWKDSVSAFSDILTKYPNPENNWAVQTDKDGTYIYTGEKWAKFGGDTIPLATNNTSGLLSSQLYNKLLAIQDEANKYVHPATHSADIITENANRRFVTSDMYNSINSFGDKINENLLNYRKKTEKIAKADLTSELASQLDSILGNVINDNIPSTNQTYSSAKILTLINTVKNDIPNEQEVVDIFNEIFKL